MKCAPVNGLIQGDMKRLIVRSYEVVETGKHLVKSIHRDKIIHEWYAV